MHTKGGPIRGLGWKLKLFTSGSKLYPLKNCKSREQKEKRINKSKQSEMSTNPPFAALSSGLHGSASPRWWWNDWVCMIQGLLRFSIIHPLQKKDPTQSLKWAHILNVEASGIGPWAPKSPSPDHFPAAAISLNLAPSPQKAKNDFLKRPIYALLKGEVACLHPFNWG